MSAKKVIKKNALAPTVLIAGGAGFIGSYLTKSLLEKGARVIVLDKLTTPNKKKYIGNLLKHPQYALFDCDINISLPEEVESVDYIFNLWGLEEYFYDKNDLDIDTLLTTSHGTKNLLDLAYKSDAKFLLASTIDVCGEASPNDIDTYLGLSKTEEKTYTAVSARKFAEVLVLEHQKKFRTDVRIVRLPEVYGPSMNLDMDGFLGPLLHDLVSDRDLSVYGDEDRKEYYIYITDAINGIIRALFNPKTSGKIYSLVGEDSHKLLTTAFLLRSLADKRVEIKFKKAAKDFVPEVKNIDTSNLSDLDWWPQVVFKEGIVKTLETLGYKCNMLSFKPLSLVNDKKKEKQQIASLIDYAKENRKDTENIQERDIESEETTKMDYSAFTKDTPFIPIQRRGLFRLNINFGGLKKLMRVFSFSKFLPKINVKSENTWVILDISAVTLVAFIIFILVPVIRLKIEMQNGVDSLQKVSDNILSLNTKDAELNAQKAYQSFDKAKISFSKLRWLYSLFEGKKGYYSASKLLSSASYFSRSVYDLSQAVSPFESVWEVLRPDSDKYLEEDMFNTLKLSILNASKEVSLAQADFKYVQKDKLPSPLHKYVDEYEGYLNTLSSGIDTVSLASTDLDNVFGLEKPKKYLILFQNSNELRPTGGFIGSYGLVEIDRGKITNLMIDDIYNPDGQIDTRNIKISPPEVVANLLAEDRMYLRNANWNPDFSKTSQDIKDLYFKITGVEVDGVVALDLYFVKNLLAVTGPIYLASYNEEITADNLYERTQYHSDFNYQDGVSTKKAFLTILGGKLMERFFSLPKEELPLMFSSVNKSLDEKHLLIYFTNSSLNYVLENMHWNGGLVKTDKDYLYIVNSNMGGTKSNYYVKPRYNYIVSSKTRDGLLRGELTLHYEHTGLDESWPGGPYKNYLRVLTQNGSKLTSAKLVSKDKEEDIFSKVVSKSVGEYTSFEFEFTLNPNSSVDIILEYDLPSNLSITSDHKEYDLLWQKQPGTDNDPMYFEFRYPFGMTVDETSGNLSSDNFKVYLESILNSNHKIYVKVR